MGARPRGTYILVVLALTNLISYAVRNALFGVVPDLEARYAIGDDEVGALATVFMIPHAAATLGFGWAGDRFDRRRVIAVGVVLASLAGLAGAVGTSYVGLAASRAAAGFGMAAIVPVANSILGTIFDGPAKASRLAIFNLGLFVGGVVGYGAGAGLGFPVVVVVLGLPGLVLAVVVLALPLPGRVVHAADVNPATSVRLAVAVRSFAADARELLRVRTLRWVIASTTIMAFAAGGLGAWLLEFLIRPVADGGKGMSKEAASSLFGLALLGGLSGIFVGARIADRLRARTAAGRMWTIVMGMALTAPCAAAAILLPDGAPLYVIGVATLFFISWYHAPMAATVDDLATPRLAVSAQGLVIFTMHMFGTAPSSWVVGAISRESTLDVALWVPAGALVVAAACMAVATTSFSLDHARARPPGR